MQNSPSSRNTAAESWEIEPEALSNMYIYKRSRRNVIWIWILIGSLHAFFFGGLLGITLLDRPWSLLRIRHLEQVLVLQYLALFGMGGATLLICGILVIGNHWPAILTGFWTMAVVSTAILLSCLCFLTPLYAMIFLESREFYLAARYLVKKGFDLRDLPKGT
ncbi:MAG: hypothetical protein C0478_08360 [Planctomyces sp.]|nr:hypothetical protein [Planctomyces sp.]